MGASPGVLQGIMGNAGEIERQNILSQQAQQAQAMAPLQQGLAREQLTGAQQENQLRAIQMKDASIMGMAMQRNPGDFNAALDWAMQNGASAPTILSYRQKQAEMAKTMADTQSLQAGAAEKTSNIAKLEDESYDTALGAALRQSKQEGWNPLELRKNFDIQASTNPNPRVAQRLRIFIAGIPQDPTAAQQYLEGGYAKTGAAKQEAEMAKEGAETAASQATTAEKTQQTRIDKIKADAMDAMKANPQSALDAIDQILPNDPMAAALKTKAQAYMKLGNFDKASSAIDEAADYAKEVAKATNPKILAAQVGQRVAEAQATAPIETNRALQVAAVNRSQTGADKLDTEYNKSKTAAEQMGRVLDLIDSDNKAAGSAMPVMNAEAINAINGIKRMNRFDIEQAGGAQAGNLWDRLSGYTEKQLSGDASIVPAIRENIRQLQQAMAEGAYSQYTTGLNALSQRTGQNLQPTIAPPNINKKPVGIAPIQLKDGRTLTPHSQADADRFRKDHPELIK